MQDNKIYVAIDLKSFYASVECKERGLDPITTNLVVADNSRTVKTICLAVSPALKSYGRITMGTNGLFRKSGPLSRASPVPNTFTTTLSSFPGRTSSGGCFMRLEV